MKLAPAFLQLKRQLLDRIRETSGMKTDLDQLQKLATQIKAAIQDVPGLTPPVIDPQETVDELHIVLRPDDLARYGLSRQYVARFIETAMKGEVVSQVLEGQRRFDLVVKLNAAYRTDYSRLGELRIEQGRRHEMPLAMLHA